MLLPAGSSLYSMSENKVTFALPGHTETLPRILIISRTRSNAAGNFSYELKNVRGVAQLDGTVANRTVTLSSRNVPNMSADDINVPMDQTEAIMATSGFNTQVGSSLIFPDGDDIAT